MNRAATLERPAPLEPDRHRGGSVSGVALALAAPGLCIVALECSQLVYHGVARPQLVGARARDFLARAPTPTRTARLPV